MSAGRARVLPAILLLSTGVLLLLALSACSSGKRAKTDLAEEPAPAGEKRAPLTAAEKLAPPAVPAPKVKAKASPPATARAPEAAPAPAVPRPPRETPWLTAAAEPRLALLIDDWGQLKTIEDQFLALDFPFSVAVIPFLTRSATDAGRAAAAGCDVLVHLPMEPEGSYNPMHGMVTTGMTDEAIKAAVTAALQAVPGAVGLNNHMGSKATADRRVMAAVLAQVKEAGLFFLDSRTGANSVATSVGDALGVPVLERLVFLDGENGTDYIRAQLLAAAKLAKARGYAIAIGHVRANTAQVLAKSVAEVTQMGVRLVKVSELVQINYAQPPSSEHVLQEPPAG